MNWQWQRLRWIQGRAGRARFWQRHWKEDQIMLRQLTISEAILVGVLCLFAMGNAKGTDSAATDCKNEYKVAIPHANADYKAVKNASDPRHGNNHHVCL
jgi:hypothetical protein